MLGRQHRDHGRQVARAARSAWWTLATTAIIAVLCAPSCTDLSNDCVLNASCPEHAAGGTGGSDGGTGAGAGTSTGGTGGDPTTSTGTTTGPTCGDGVVEPGEPCDDGGTSPGDGCDPACTVEPGWSCTGEPSACTPDPRPPYFMVTVDSSGSMLSPLGSPSSCGFGSQRIDHARCALHGAFQAFEGQARLGLATYARQIGGCLPTCFDGCAFSNYPGNTTNDGCGPRPGGPETRAGAAVRVGIAPWNTNSNLADLLSWVDDDCTESKEVFGDALSPLNGVLRDMARYFESGWTSPDGAVTLPSPLGPNDKATGPGCVSVNAVLIIDGDDSCDTPADAIAAAQALHDTGVTPFSETFTVRTFVVDFGANDGFANALAAAGGTGAAYPASNDGAIQTAMEAILAAGGCN